MTFPNNLREIRKSLGVKATDLADLLEVTFQHYYAIERGQRQLSATHLSKLANFLKVSTDEILGKAPTQTKASEIKKDQDLPDLNEKDEKDIAKMLDEMKERLMQEQGLMFDGDPASPESIQSILDAMQIGMEMAKKRNKAKYTPKKYRKE